MTIKAQILEELEQIPESRLETVLIYSLRGLGSDKTHSFRGGIHGLPKRLSKAKKQHKSI